jgi:hypothetical protein
MLALNIIQHRVILQKMNQVLEKSNSSTFKAEESSTFGVQNSYALKEWAAGWRNPLGL